MDRPSILIVEDDDGIRDTLVECLGAEGYAVTAVSNGAEALASLGRERPGLILVDLVMPVMTGAELLERIRAAPATRDLPVVLMTAAAADARNPLPAADAVLSKPFELGDLLAAVSRHHLRS